MLGIIEKEPKGCLITLEGGEGGGKSTAVAYVRTYLEAQGLEVVISREPGGTLIGEELRRLVLSAEGLSSDAELLLFMASRAQHIDELIRPALARGAWVVLDRYYDASLAYQGAGREFGVERVSALLDWLKPIRPDLTLLLDITPATGLARVERRSEKDRFERETLAFFERIRQCYLDLAQQEPLRFKKVDAEQPLEAVFRQIEVHLARFLETQNGVRQR